MVNDKARRSVIQFEDVSFEYPGAETDSIHHISLDVKEGEFLVLTGGSGWVNVQCEQLFFRLNVEFTSETVEILVTADEVKIVGQGMSYDVSYQVSSEIQLRLNSLRGEDETCVHLTWGEDGLHVSTVQTSKLAIEDMMGEPREMPPGGFVIKYPNSVVD